MFAYCNNAPVNTHDSSGTYAIVQDVNGESHRVHDKRNEKPQSVGAAKPYKKIKESDGDRNLNPNCYSYALGYYGKSYDPGEMADVRFTCTVDSVAGAVEEDMETLGRGCRRLNAYDSAIANNEYRVALRVSQVYLNEFSDGSIALFWDYHFMVQTSSGGWAEKHGPGGPTVYHHYGTPETLSWDYGDIKGFYDSKIVYFAFTD